MSKHYDIIVVGAGHAGCEAAAIASKLGAKVLLITLNMQTIGQMSCNPAMGGIAKGQIIREIDALGGYSGILTDKSTIQFRMLNKSKGPAMWSPRSQNDRSIFASEWRKQLESMANIDFWQDMAEEIIVKNDRAVGVKTQLGVTFNSNAVILTNGTFLNGIIHIGEKQFGGGRIGEKASKGITDSLTKIGFISGRMKTGTPPRIDGRSINYSLIEEQRGDEFPEKFSFSSITEPVKNQLSCYITYTNEKVHEILEKGFSKSPMYSGRILGIGPRYCPSIEDKISRFADRDRHQLFIEPEGRDTVEIYLNGFSTSLPEDIQIEALKNIKGLENVKIFRPGYAIEYDYFPPTQLNHSLETKIVSNLFFAGQINGTTGYEEAACQGLIAGINAYNAVNNREALVIKRSEAYIGVLIDDLVTKGTEEPYRMFTSRSEFRTSLRQDNADLRLMDIARGSGTISEVEYAKLRAKKKDVGNMIELFKNRSVEPSQVNDYLVSRGTNIIAQKVKFEALLLRPQIQMDSILNETLIFSDILSENKISREIIKQAEIEIKYQSYIEKEKSIIQKMLDLENLQLDQQMDYSNINSLSIEARQKLNKIKPTSIGQASRISGVSPSDLSILLSYLGR